MRPSADNLLSITKPNDYLAGHLAILAAVAEHGSVTGAARSLSLTQPAVSNRLRTLENLVGGRVVTRRGRSAALTELGLRLLPHARAIERATTRASLAASSEPESAREVRIALSEASVPLVMPRLAACARTAPQLRLSVLPRDAATSVGAVVAGEVDLAITVAPPDQRADDLQRRPLLLDDIVLVRTGKQPATTTLKTVPSLTVLWQAAGSGVRATVEWILEANGVWPAEQLELGSSLGALAAAAAGEGAAFLPRSFATPWADAGRISMTMLRASDLYARFELMSEPVDQLPAGVRRVYDALLRPPPS